MPRKKAFTKENSEKFLLLRGSEQAVNADGETLQNILVPVSKNYKPGTSLLFSNIAALSNLGPEEDLEENKDIEGIFDDASIIEDFDAAEGIVKGLLSDTKNLKVLRISEEIEDDALEDIYDDDDDVEEEDNDFNEGSNSKQSETKKDQICSENWKMFNEKFDKIMEGYDEDDIGSLEDDDEICAMQMASSEFFDHDSKEYCKKLETVLADYDEELKAKILNYVEGDSDDEKVVEIVTEKPLEYDCESILSTYSNKYNHPTVVKEERVHRVRNLSQSSQIESDVQSLTKTLLNTCNIRKKDETPEERKERQKKFKEAKKLRRELKKQNKEAFKEEKKVQTVKSQQNTGMMLL